ncbi:imelysin family protein [Teredinibacter turnerae]|uniref:imelysin family protein n=1 Tax=Teredinibacter turnerae TaxID=2426 RepID=UPI00036D33C8|nr:imelysin family protein [Teredinibacter turnerae]
MDTRILSACCLSLCCWLSACQQKSNEPAEQATPTPQATGVDMSEQNKTYWDTGSHVLASSLNAAQKLQALIRAFLANPSGDTLAAAQEQWIHTESAWQSFFFYSQWPVTLTDVYAPLSPLLFNIGARPIQPGYLDYVGPYPYAGLVHDISVPLSAESLEEQHGMMDAEAAALGIYAIEFMLFGEQNTRPSSDYQPATTLTSAQREQGFQQAIELPANRRRELLNLQTDLLVAHLTALQNLWSDDSKNSIRSHWQRMSNDAQQVAMLSNLERTTTHLLLEIARATPNAQPAEPIDGKPLSPSALAQAVSSLKIASAWLVDPEPIDARACFDNVATQLRNATTVEAWSDIYQLFRTCANSDASSTLPSLQEQDG